MTETLQFVVRHGYLLVFAWVFIEQAGLPVPSAPLLLAMGALAGMHQMNLWLAVALALAAAVSSDSMWYELGRSKRGPRSPIALPDFAGTRFVRSAHADEFRKKRGAGLARREIYSRPQCNGGAARGDYPHGMAAVPAVRCARNNTVGERLCDDGLCIQRRTRTRRGQRGAHG